MSDRTVDLQRVANRVLDHVRTVQGELALLSKKTTELIGEVRRRGGVVNRSDLTRLNGHLKETLRSTNASMDGIGVATVPGYLEDCRYWLEWWRSEPRGDVEFVVHSLNPTQDAFYDYPTRPWFARSLDEQRTIITGPYVDAGGTDAYTVTVATPIEVGGETIGVAGADVVPTRFESYLFDFERGDDASMLLLANSDGRVIVSASSAHPPGTLLPASESENWARVTVDHGAPAEQPWQLLALP